MENSNLTFEVFIRMKKANYFEFLTSAQQIVLMFGEPKEY